MEKLKKGKIPKDTFKNKQFFNRIIYNFLHRLSVSFFYFIINIIVNFKDKVIPKSYVSDIEANMLKPTLLKKTIQQFPDANRCTLAYLLIFVHNIILYGDYNHHTPQLMSDQLKFLLFDGRGDETMALINLPVTFWQRLL